MAHSETEFFVERFIKVTDFLKIEITLSGRVAEYTYNISEEG